MKNLIKYASLTLIAAVLAATPMVSRAQDAAPTTPAVTPADSSTTNTPPVKKKKAAGLPFHGKIATLDASAGTFTVGELSLTVTSATKISTNGVPATLADFKVGDNVQGAYKKTTDGALNVTTLRLAKKKKAPAAQ